MLLDAARASRGPRLRGEPARERRPSRGGRARARARRRVRAGVGRRRPARARRGLQPAAAPRARSPSRALARALRAGRAHGPGRDRPSAGRAGSKWWRLRAASSRPSASSRATTGAGSGCRITRPSSPVSGCHSPRPRKEHLRQGGTSTWPSDEAQRARAAAGAASAEDRGLEAGRQGAQRELRERCLAREADHAHGRLAQRRRPQGRPGARPPAARRKKGAATRGERRHEAGRRQRGRLRQDASPSCATRCGRT